MAIKAENATYGVPLPSEDSSWTMSGSAVDVCYGTSKVDGDVCFQTVGGKTRDFSRVPAERMDQVGPAHGWEKDEGRGSSKGAELGVLGPRGGTDGMCQILLLFPGLISQKRSVQTSASDITGASVT